jgi:hypothetical protein
MWVTDRPKPRNATVTAYAPSASTLLHEIADKFLTYATDGPFTSQQSDKRTT